MTRRALLLQTHHRRPCHRPHSSRPWYRRSCHSISMHHLRLLWWRLHSRRTTTTTQVWRTIACYCCPNGRQLLLPMIHQMSIHRWLLLILRPIHTLSLLMISIRRLLLLLLLTKRCWWWCTSTMARKRIRSLLLSTHTRIIMYSTPVPYYYVCQTMEGISRAVCCALNNQ